jgi:hypothetical protein
MANQNSFTPEEWDLLRSAPAMTGMLVVVADPSGPIGLLQESSAMAAMVLKEAKQCQTELMKSLAEDYEKTMHMPRLVDKAPEAMKSTGMAHLKQVAELVRLKASEAESAELRSFLHTTAKKVAEASKEGGFLGFGGTLISQSEEQILREIAFALGISA